MKERTQPSVELLRLADAQASMLTVEQARAFGVGRNSLARLVRHGQWQRTQTGLYFLGRGAPAWLSVAWGGVLLGGEGARLGDGAAAHLHGLQPDPPRDICVRVGHGVRRSLRWPYVFRQERPGIRMASVGNPPRTSIEDTVLDLAETVSAAELIGLVTAAVQITRSPKRLRRRLEQRRHVAQRQLLTALLADVEVGVESPLERRYLHDVERAHGLPKGDWQSRNDVGDRRDVRYREFAVLVELDGRLGHEGMGRFRDMWRDNHHLLGGEVTLRFGYRDILDDSCLVAWQVGTLLAGRGWLGVPQRCPRCLEVPDFG